MGAFSREAFLPINPCSYRTRPSHLSLSLSLSVALTLVRSPTLSPQSSLIVVPGGITQTVLVVPMRGSDLTRDLIARTTIAPLPERTEILIVPWLGARPGIYNMSAVRESPPPPSVRVGAIALGNFRLCLMRIRGRDCSILRSRCVRAIKTIV